MGDAEEPQRSGAPGLSPAGAGRGGRPPWRRWGVGVLLSVSLLGWGTWTLTKDLCHPYADLSCGNYTDHFSHMNTARLFTHAGIDIWREPLRELTFPLTPEERARLPADVRTAAREAGRVPGWPSDKPFISSWSKNPRFHPPGDMILTAPVALAYHLTSLSFSDANRLLTALFLVYAHVSLYLFFRSPPYPELRPTGLLVVFLVYSEVVYLTLQGFYEAAVIGPLVLCAWALYRRQGIAALALFAVAAFLHFRALFFLPWAAYALYLIFRERQWASWKSKQIAQAGVAAVLGSATLSVFLLLLPHLTTIRANNPVGFFARNFDAKTIAFVGVALLVAGALAHARAWLDVAIVLWAFLVMSMLRETYPWDVLSLLAWLGAPVRADRRRIVRYGRLVAILFVAVAVFRNLSFGISLWLERVF